MTGPDDVLRMPYRPVRPVEGRSGGPWPGMLTAFPSGDRWVLVDGALLPERWRGWSASPSGHVLSALDVVRRIDGHSAVLPICIEPLESFIARRSTARSSLARGEAVTIGVSLVRGTLDMMDFPKAVGEWWVTESGQPVFATDASSTPFVEATLRVLDAVATCVPHQTVWTDAVSAISEPRVSAAELDRAEAGIFALASPLPLSRDSALTQPPRSTVEGPATVTREESEPRQMLWASLARHVDSDLADLVSQATTALWRRARTRGERRTPRRAPVLVAAGVAAVVLGVGMAWPGGPANLATADSAGTPGGASAEATPLGTPSPGVDDGEVSAETDGEDLESLTTRLLDRASSCGDDLDCLARFTLDAAQPLELTGVTALSSTGRTVALLDDFGGVAVLRVDPTSGKEAAQLVVIARKNDEWLLRDIHDVTQQP